MNSKQLCLKLLAVESEKEVQRIIEKTPEMSDPNNWNPLDDRDTNFNVVTNQAMTGGKAATELMTNMVDAMLMKNAYQKKINPKGKNAPKSMYNAVDDLITNLYGGKLINADESWLRSYSSKNLVIGITGAKGQRKSGSGAPCFTFADNGEGQHPEDFRTTFLSLSAGNKKDIAFVQGKFNMGSSGVLNFCGEHWFKLIVSRRYDKSGIWGWTLIRRRPESPMPVADYFKIGDKIPTFGLDHLFPFKKKNGEYFDDFSLCSGTVIKLYDFFLGSGHNDFRAAREAFNENLVESILPFKIYDFRQKPSPGKGKLREQGIDERPFYGMSYLLLRSHAGDIEEKEISISEQRVEKELTVGIIQDPKLGKIHITAIPLKEIPGWLKKGKSINRVFHSVNGQVQFKQTRGFLTQCGYPALKDKVVIIVNASELSFEAHNDVWKGDREHLRETLTGDYYKSVIKETLQRSEILKELQKKIAQQELDRATKEGTSFIFQKLVDKDKNLANLLDNKDPSIIPGISNSEIESEYKGKFSPTFLTIERKFQGREIEISTNKGRPIAAKTDAANDYFHRPDTTGYLYISDDQVRKFFRIRQSLKDGRLIVYFSPVSDTGLFTGMRFSFELGLQDPAMPMPVTDLVNIVVTGESQKPKPEPKPPIPHEEKPKKSLPKYRLLTKDGREISGQSTDPWPEEEFNHYDGGIVEDMGEDGLIYKINYDNAYHIRYLQDKKDGVEKDSLTEKYILGMRLLMLGFERAVRDIQSSSDNNFEDFKDQFRQMAAKGAATTVLSLTEVLPKVLDMTDDEPE